MLFNVQLQMMTMMKFFIYSCENDTRYCYWIGLRSHASIEHSITNAADSPEVE